VQPSNMGVFTRTRFDMVYEAGINVSWQVMPWLSVVGGYSFLWWVNPIRAGDQVDTVINLTAAGPIRPVIPFKQDGLIAHGLTIGLAFRW
jgi:Putative beta barrel porin-7 (BBP7)